jgi:glutamate formiminotransferase/formiminotetrahydrofolate cyclodeaminase
MDQLLECVPNFSEGRDLNIIRQITSEIGQVAGVKLLHVDPGADANRTVVTFIGQPEAVTEAAFAAIQTATHLIDMRKHHGEHPRLGAVDVCPLVPYCGIPMDQTVVLARQLARRVGEELHIPVYCYGSAAFKPDRRNLATIRSGEYEKLDDKLRDPRWKPDFGPAAFNAKTGATVIGARDFLIAYNVNLDTTDVAIANEIAQDVRESGRMQRNPATKDIIRDAGGNPIRIPGTLKAVKAIGWMMEAYGCCQVSMNLVDIKKTPMHIAFIEVRSKAEARGIQVTGSELIGMVPLQAMLEAGAYAIHEQKGAAEPTPDACVDDAKVTHLPHKQTRGYYEF